VREKEGLIVEQYDVVIVGAGPAGIFTALELFEIDAGLKVMMLDMGRTIKNRVCVARLTNKCVSCQPCAVTSGWAGAGAFSDGKLSLSPEVGGRILDYFDVESVYELINYTDELYLRFGADNFIYGAESAKVDEIKYNAAKHNIQLVPCSLRHLGTENAAKVLEAMYGHLISQKNFTFRELTQACDLLVENKKVMGLVIKQSDGKEELLYSRCIVAAPGRSGAGWLSELAKKHGIQTFSNEVEIGVRVEVHNSVMEHLTRDLYEVKLVYYSDTFENKVRTFCMNPGGIVSEEHYDGRIAAVNGHSYADPSLKTDNTNFAVLVSTKFTEPFNQPIDYGMYIAKLGNMLTGGGIMVQRLGDLLAGRRTDHNRLKRATTIPTLKSAVPGDLSYVLPHRYLASIVESLKAFDKIAPGLYSKDVLLYGVEVKFYSSKIEVDNSFETRLKGLYAIGDGAGITRGLMQASASGVVVARSIVAG